MRSPKPAPTSLDEMADLLHRDSKGPGWSLLAWLADAAFLTSDLIARRFYPTPQGVRSATYRMAQLASWGLVARRFLRRHRQVWYLTDQGARLTADYLNRPVSEVGASGSEARMAEGFIRHRLAVTEFEVALRLHAQAHRGNLVSFVREPEIVIPGKEPGKEREAAKKLRPDVAFIYSERGKTWNYALEVDRNTERASQFTVTKLPRYEALARAEWRQYWDSEPTCLVVVMVGGPARVARLKAEIDSLPVTGGEYRLFKFACAGDLYSMPLSHMHSTQPAEIRFDQPVCLAARKPETERRAVFG